jgi:NAD(P)-dependent dehydrogenase (short-subunit alcohol dehydrogenase family)
MNFIGSHPLNLIGKGTYTTRSLPSPHILPLTKPNPTVAIITSASSSLGAAICRSLLNSNALVLGLDTVPAHKTTSASGGSHFQFLQYDAKKGLEDGRVILEKLRSVYLKDGVDLWIDVVGEGKGELEIGGLNEVIEGMSEREEGLVLSVVGDVGREVEVVRLARNFTAQY